MSEQKYVEGYVYFYGTPDSPSMSHMLNRPHCPLPDHAIGGVQLRFRIQVPAECWLTPDTVAHDLVEGELTHVVTAELNVTEEPLEARQ